MSRRTAPRLPLAADEREALRRSGIRIGDIAELDASALAQESGLPRERCEELRALSEFQALGSVGPSIAADFWALGYRSVADLRDQNPKAMVERFEELVGQPVDPCVEDTFRCAVAQATHGDLPAPLRHWWRWMSQRGEETVTVPDGELANVRKR